MGKNMKETVIVMMVIAFCYSCTTENSKSIKNIQVSKGSAQNISIENNSLFKLIQDSIPPTKIVGDKSLSFKFNIDSSGSLLKTINVYSEKNLIQKITANKYFESNKFELIDWNFDGAKDITVIYNCGSGGCAYWIWNYSPTTNKFIFNKELSEVLGLEIDTANQFIVFHYRAGYSQERWDSLKYVNNNLQFVKGRYRERWNDSLGNSWVKNTYSKMVNNVLVTNVDSSISK